LAALLKASIAGGDHVRRQRAARIGLHPPLDRGLAVDGESGGAGGRDAGGSQEISSVGHRSSPLLVVVYCP
jgi:hypothetical protein